jgi:hypothetical protein
VPACPPLIWVSAGAEPVDSDVTRSTNGMTVVVIGAIVLVASANSWFPPGIAIGVGLIGLGAAIGLVR